MPTSLVGVDAGTTTIKAVAFTLDGEELAGASRATPLHKPEAGRVEQDMVATWERTAAAIADVTESLERDVAAVGVTGQGDGCWLVDADGRPVRNAILWSDGRAADYVREWQASGRASRIFETCGSAPFPGSSAPILNWLHEEEPLVLDRAETVLFCKDWLRYRLTGTLATDPSDASLPYLDVEREQYVDGLDDLLDVPGVDDLLPPISQPTEIAGRVTEPAAAATGLAAGTPVVTGVIDIAASAYGSGVAMPGTSSSVVGTTSLNQTLLDSPEADPSGVGFTLALGDGRWTRAMASMAGTPNLDWVLEEIDDSDCFGTLERAVESVPVGADGVLYHPYLSASGERSPFLRTTARAQFTGLDPEHTRAHLLRAVYEGVALAMRDCYEHITGTTDRVYMSGGGARSELWCQLFADCLDATVAVPAGEEFGARGAALLAGIATDAYDDLPSAVAETTAIDRSYDPRPDATAKYDALYDLYCETYEAMFDVWDRREEVLAEIRAEGE